MQVRRLTAGTILPIVIVGGLVACSGSKGSGSSSTDSSKTVVTVGIGEPKNLIPPNAGETEGGQVVYATFAGLLDYDKDGKAYSVIADSITSTDSKVWTIKLKDGFTFHNGEKVTSQSFIDSWNWGAYGPNGSDVNSYYKQIDGYDPMNPTDAKATPTAKTLSGLKKVDDLTFTVTLTSPFVDFNVEMGYTAFFPMPKVAFAADGSITKEYQEAPIGDGPFKIKGKWNHDQNIETERYDGWKGQKVKVAGINFKIYQDPKAQYTDALADGLDVDRRVDTSNLANAKSDFGSRYKTSDSSAVQFLGIPTYDPKFANPDVRKAISMAIDRDQLATTVYSGTVKPLRSWLSPLIPGYRADACGASCQYNPTAAKALYQSANGPSTLQITYNADGPHKQAIEAVCNELQTNLGITCQAKAEPKFADLLTKLKNKDPNVGLFRTGWVMDYPSMYDYLFPLYGTGSIPDPNYSGYSNKIVDDLIQQGTEAKTEADAIKLWQQAEDQIAKDMPYIPLRSEPNNYVTSHKIKNADVNLFSWVNPYTVEAG
jgi:oligopeptide transport system substrate-binding protein